MSRGPSIDRVAANGRMADRAEPPRTLADRLAAERDAAQDAPPSQGSMESDGNAILQLRPRPDFVRTDALDALAARADSYLQAGYPLHFRGPAGSGKDHPGPACRRTAEAPGAFAGGRRKLRHAPAGGRRGRVSHQARGRSLHQQRHQGGEHIGAGLAGPCPDRGLHGRLDPDLRRIQSRATAANNVLLTVLEERLLVLPKSGRGESYLRVHPQFRAIFTSNPSDHTGAHDAQDALLDRMITLDLDCFDNNTEVAIAAARSGLPFADAARIVDVVRDFRNSGEYAQRPTMRASIMIARMAAQQRMRVSAEDQRFVQLCLDLLGSRVKPGPRGLPDPRHQQMLVKLIQHFCGSAPEREYGT